jgi:hypothetical protein
MSDARHGGRGTSRPGSTSAVVVHHNWRIDIDRLPFGHDAPHSIFEVELTDLDDWARRPTRFQRDHRKEQESNQPALRPDVHGNLQ